VVVGQEAQQSKDASRERSNDHHYKGGDPGDVRDVFVFPLLSLEDAEDNEYRGDYAEDTEGVDYDGRDEERQHEFVYPAQLNLL